MAFEKAYELKTKADKFVNSNFNFIQLGVVEREAEHEGMMLIELIEQEYIDDYDILDWYSEQDDTFREEMYEDMGTSKVSESEIVDYLQENYSMEIQEYFEESRENYPMWNTLFEFRSEPPAEWLEKAKEAGFGVISDFGDFNSMLFVAGAGYSFFSQHWIPLWLSIFAEYDSEDYSNVDYSMMV